MRTSLNKIQLIEEYLLGRMTPGDAVVFEAGMVLDEELGRSVREQQAVYEVVRAYGREQIRGEIRAVQERVDKGLMNYIIGLFKNK